MIIPSPVEVPRSAAEIRESLLIVRAGRVEGKNFFDIYKINPVLRTQRLGSVVRGGMVPARRRLGHPIAPKKNKKYIMTRKEAAASGSNKTRASRNNSLAIAQVHCTGPCI